MFRKKDYSLQLALWCLTHSCSPSFTAWHLNHPWSGQATVIKDWSGKDLIVTLTHLHRVLNCTCVHFCKVPSNKILQEQVSWPALIMLNLPMPLHNKQLQWLLELVHIQKWPDKLLQQLLFHAILTGQWIVNKAINNYKLCIKFTISTYLTGLWCSSTVCCVGTITFRCLWSYTSGRENLGVS